MSDFKPLQTAAEVIEALGGDDAVKALTSCSSQTLWNWKDFGRFPSNLFVVMTAALALKGKSAPASLWRMRNPAVPAE